MWPRTHRYTRAIIWSTLDQASDRKGAKDPLLGESVMDHKTEIRF